MNPLKYHTIKVLACILPDRLKNAIFHLSYHIAQSEFQRFCYDYAFAPHMSFGLESLAKRGFVPKTVIDVGAYHGDWSMLARRIWPASRLFIVEPNVKKQPALVAVASELKAELLCELLGSVDGQVVDFNVMESGSSIMSERSTVPRTIEARQLRTLDSLLPDIEGPGLIKIDAQGYELEILRGASRILPAFEAVLLEIAIIEINEGAPLLHDVTAFMKMAGYVAYDILELHRRPLDGALNQVDILFLRENSNLLADKRHFA